MFPRLHEWLATAGTVEKRYHPEAVALLESGEAVIFSWWHEYVLILAPEGTPYNSTTMLTSPSDDGKILAESIVRMGYQVVEGSSRRGGAAAMENLQTVLGNGRNVLITPDGPMGPMHEVKSGVLRLSAATGKAIIPVTASLDRYKRLGTWDRLIVPLRPRKLTIQYHAPLWVNARQLPQYRYQLVQSLSRLP